MGRGARSQDLEYLARRCGVEGHDVMEAAKSAMLTEGLGEVSKALLGLPREGMDFILKLFACP